MSQKTVDQIILANRPESLKLSQEQVKEVLAANGYALVPCYSTAHRPVLTRGTDFDGVVGTRWGLKDIEEAGYYTFRRPDGTFTLLEKEEASHDAEYVPVMESWPLLETEGYKLVFPYVATGKFYTYLAAGAPERHIVDFARGHEFKGELAVWWSGVVEDNRITYKPYIPGFHQAVPEHIEQILIEAAGAKPIVVKIDPPIVEMPLPDWANAREHYLETEQLTLPEARERAAAFVQRLREAGLVD